MGYGQKDCDSCQDRDACANCSRQLCEPMSEGDGCVLQFCTKKEGKKYCLDCEKEGNGTTPLKKVA